MKVKMKQLIKEGNFLSHLHKRTAKEQREIIWQASFPEYCAFDVYQK